MAERAEPTRDQIAQDYTKALTLIDSLRRERDLFQKKAQDWNTEADRYLAQRDELLVALIAIEDGDSDCGCSHDTPDCCAVVGAYCPRCIAAAAIAKAEGR